ncbi:MAG: hypothetical protein IMZ62_00350 [Chloroflexi bacterium]|nr:hypothetical protein [Chloroflexota bacterium]
MHATGKLFVGHSFAQGEVEAASCTILTGLLREKLDFDGLVVSDYSTFPRIQFFTGWQKIIAMLPSWGCGEG